MLKGTLEGANFRKFPESMSLTMQEGKKAGAEKADGRSVQGAPVSYRSSKKLEAMIDNSLAFTCPPPGSRLEGIFPPASPLPVLEFKNKK